MEKSPIGVFLWLKLFQKFSRSFVIHTRHVKDWFCSKWNILYFCVLLDQVYFFCLKCKQPSSGYYSSIKLLQASFRAVQYNFLLDFCLISHRDWKGAVFFRTTASSDFISKTSQGFCGSRVTLQIERDLLGLLNAFIVWHLVAYSHCKVMDISSGGELPSLRNGLKIMIRSPRKKSSKFACNTLWRISILRKEIYEDSL